MKILFLFSLLTLVSCVSANYMPVDELNFRQKNEHISVLLNHPYFDPDFVFDFEDQLGNRFDFLIYKSNIKTNIDHSVPTKSDIHHYLIFAYKNQKLVYWGFPHEFTRNNDEFVRRIGEKICASLLNGDAQPFVRTYPKQEEVETIGDIL
jgi:hypothetical protein